MFNDLQINASIEDLAFLIKFCVRELRPLIDARKQKIDIEIQDEIITRFEKEKMFEVITNLLSNAIKYTPPKGNIKIQSEIRDNFHIMGSVLPKRRNNRFLSNLVKLSTMVKDGILELKVADWAYIFQKRLLNYTVERYGLNQKGEIKNQPFIFHYLLFRVNYN